MVPQCLDTAKKIAPRTIIHPEKLPFVHCFSDWSATTTSQLFSDNFTALGAPKAIGNTATQQQDQPVRSAVSAVSSQRLKFLHLPLEKRNVICLHKVYIYFCTYIYTHTQICTFCPCAFSRYPHTSCAQRGAEPTASPAPLPLPSAFQDGNF